MAKQRENQHTRLPSAPPPLFTGKKERDFVAHITLETQERIIGQQIVYYPIDMPSTNYHPTYGEAIKKNFLPPIRVYAAVSWEGSTTETGKAGLDRVTEISVHFFKRRLTEEVNLYVRVGDFIQYGTSYYEIVELGEPRELFGQVEHKLEIEAKCIKAREGLFDV